MNADELRALAADAREHRVTWITVARALDQAASHPPPALPRQEP